MSSSITSPVCMYNHEYEGGVLIWIRKHSNSMENQYGAIESDWGGFENVSGGKNISEPRKHSTY
jgi:hypothetical protein